MADSHDPLVKNTHPSVITGRKWKAKIALQNAESTLKMREIIGTVANGNAGLSLYQQRWSSKKSPINKIKMLSEEIHHLKEVTCIATAVGQRKRDA